MKFTAEQITKMKAATSAEELIALAKAEGIEATEEEIKAQFDAMHKEGEIADEELNNVAGGFFCDSRPDPVDVESQGGGVAKCPSCGGLVSRWKDQVGVGENAYELHGCTECGRTFRRYYDDEWTEN